MNALVLLLIPVVLAAPPHGYIIEGEDVDIADYPWQGSYRSSSGTHLCGCVFVGGTWTMTAAHCGGSSSWTVGFGNSDRTSVTPYSIAEVTIHPQYEQGSGFLPNDFTIIETNSVPRGTNISPARIASNGNNPGGNGAITGWGWTCDSCGTPDTLQGIPSMPIISDNECTRIAIEGEFNPDYMICVFNGSQGSCNGDSGGPLTKGSTLYGVASFGPQFCYHDKRPSVYAKVGAVRSWICRTTDNGANGC